MRLKKLRLKELMYVIKMNIVFEDDEDKKIEEPVVPVKTFMEGTGWFVTISLHVDYVPCSEIKQFLNKHFIDKFGVIEKGQNGKQHFHFVGVSKIRKDNLNRGLKSILSKKYDVSKYSIDIMAEPNFGWRIGYMQKEQDYETVINDYDNVRLAEAKAIYSKKPKRERKDKQDKVMTENQIADYLLEVAGRDTYLIKQHLMDMIKNGKIPYSTYKKLNIKCLFEYLTLDFNI